MDISLISLDIRFATADMPALGMDLAALSLPYWVYVLRCGDKFYVGIAPAFEAIERMRKHYRGEGAHFTQMYPPTEVCLLWPCPTRAAEAYVYYALVDAFPGVLIGGWVQTSSKPSPLVCLLTKEARSNLQGMCFTCNEKSHFARDCPRRNTHERTCFYECKAPGCGNLMYLTTRGQTPLSLPSGAKALAADGDGYGDGGGDGDGGSSRVRVNVPAPSLFLLVGGDPSISSSSSIPPQVAPTAAGLEQPRCGHAEAPSRKRIRGKQASATNDASDVPDITFEDAWFAARKKLRGGNLAEVASLRDIVGLMNTRKSLAAEKHLNDRVKVWIRRYEKRVPRDCVEQVEIFRSRTGGGSGGVGATEEFARAIWKELSKA